jgi:hypothetical protein
MIFNKSERIRNLERDLKWETYQHEQLKEKYWQLRHDIDMLAAHLGLSFVDIHKRVVEKKGGPEKP